MPTLAPRAHRLPAALLAFTLVVAAAAPSASATVTAAVQGTTLEVAGDGADDSVKLADNGLNVDVDLTGDGTSDASFVKTTFDAIAVRLGGGNDVLTATALLPGALMTIDGEAGADTITGGVGPDTISGGDGPDLLAGYRNDDTIAGGAGEDTIEWNPGDGNDTVDGGADADAFLFTGANIAEIVALAPATTAGHARLTRNVANIVHDLVGVERVSVDLLGGVDVFTSAAGVAPLFESVSVDAGAGADTLTGGDERDVLVGGADADVLNGGGGDDTLAVTTADAPGDTFDGGAGTDLLAVAGTGASETFTVSSPIATSIIVGEALSASSFAAANTERASIEASGGDDTVTVAAGGPVIDADGGPGNDRLTGQDGDDVLRGGDGADRLTGGGGADQLFGDAGQDLLLGGAGADRFSCGGLGDSFDAGPEDVLGADCVPAPIAVPVATQPAPQVIPDTTPPTLKLSGAPKTIKRATLLKSGVAIAITPSEASTLEAALLVSARSARIAAASPNLTLASRTLPRAAGRRSIRLKPSKTLIGKARRFTLTIRITATDAAGNRKTVTQRVSVR